MRNADCGMRNLKPLFVALFFFATTGIASAAQDQQIQQKLATLEKLQGKFSFIVIGDNRSGDDVYRKIVSLAMERKPDLLVNTGDMIATPGDRQEWTKFWDLSRPVTVPYFLTVGNHDIHSKVPFSERTYKEQVDLPGNELYYSFKAGNALFVVLDTYLDDQEKKVTGEQLKWLEGVLSSTSRKHTFVFVHAPLYPDKDRGKHHGNSLDRYPKERDALQALLVKHKVTAVFTGHEHLYLRKTVDTILHVIAGGGGAPLYADDMNGGFYHYIYVTVDGDRVSAEVVDISGKVRDRF
jgi:predicted phosphodiesterase